jgi:hypothetical protein
MLSSSLAFRQTQNRRQPVGSAVAVVAAQAAHRLSKGRLLITAQRPFRSRTAAAAIRWWISAAVFLQEL